MSCTFNGQSIFGSFNKVTGPSRGYRAMRSQLPAVDGVRVYRLGKDTQIWIVRGRITGASLSSVLTTINAGLALHDGQTHAFVDLAGTSHSNCMLNDYRPIGNYRAIILAGGSGATTVEVQGTVEQLAPDV
jgi:hypothetical protein